MAQRRMTSLEVIDTDAFLDMGQGAQLLYFHLNSRADDDGFVANPKKILRAIGGNDDDLRLLILKKFLIAFDDGVCVIKHWRINNFVRKDIYQETKYLDHKQALFIRGNGTYTLTDDGRAIKVPPKHYTLEHVNDTLTTRQLSIGKDREENTSANAETYLSSDWHIEEDTAKPKRTEALAKPHEFIEIWNRYSDWKKLGIKDTPANPSVKEKLLPEAKSTTSLTGALVKARNKLSAQEFEKAVKNYVTELVNRKKDEKGYYQHRYTLYMFVVHKNVLENYVNR